MKLDSTRTAAVDHRHPWRTMRHCPRGVRVLLLGAGGVAVIGTWDGRDTFWQGWAPLPTRRRATDAETTIGEAGTARVGGD